MSTLNTLWSVSSYLAMMKGGCAVFLFYLSLLLSTTVINVDGKVFTRCALTRELLQNHFPRTFMSNWVCLVEQVSQRNTSAFVDKGPRRKYYGLFQIGSEWCKEGRRRGGKCDISCEALLDDNIQDDCVCAMQVFEREGFKYWTRWEQKCKGQWLPDIEKCPDWDEPPSRSSITPERVVRNIGLTTISRYRRFKRFLEESKHKNSMNFNYDMEKTVQ